MTMVYFGVGITVATAMGVAAAADAFLSGAESLAAAVRIALPHVPPPDTTGGIDLIHICFPYSDLIRGKQIALLALLVGGVPAAMIGAGLEAGVRRPWSGAWATAFLAGLIFQVNSLVFTVFLLFLVAVPTTIFAPLAVAVATAGGILCLIACNIWGLHSWRALQLAARETPPRVTPA
jgi:hypothetical protein